MTPKDKAIYLFLTIVCYLFLQNIRVSFQLTVDTTKEFQSSIPVLPQQSPPTISSNNSTQPRTSQDCRLQWDLQKKHTLINEWVALELPILVSVVRHDRGADPQREGIEPPFHNKLKPDMVYSTFTQAHLRQNNNVDLDFRTIPWKCIYEGTQTVEELAQPIPYAKPDAILNLLCNSTANHQPLTGIAPVHSTNTTYSLKKPLECDRLEEQELSAIHNSNTLGACLRFRGDYDRSLVPQWIEYHRLLGIQHFWIYINEEWNLTGLYNTSYITYVPYDFFWDPHQPHFPHHYASYDPELSQEPAIYNCVWTAKKYGYQWVTTTDVDEWMRVPPIQPQNQTTTLPLQAYFQKFQQQQQQQIGCLIMKSVPYGSNKWLPDPKIVPPTLLMDYVWRQNKSLADYYSREKPIFHPQSVWSMGVHFCWKTNKLELKPQDKDVYVQHYKLAHKGVYKKMAKKMVESQDELVQDATVRDNYKAKLVQALQELQQQSNEPFY